MTSARVGTWAWVGVGARVGVYTWVGRRVGVYTWVRAYVCIYKSLAR